MSVALASSSTPISTQQEPLRVMVVDDSVVIRGLIARWVASEPDMVVAASLRTGLDAVNQLERINPDVAVLDIEMPDLDGIAALPLLLAKKRNLIIIMASTLTRRNAEISFKALSLGASDYIPKPESTREAGGGRNLSPRSHSEDLPSRRQGPPRFAHRLSLAPALEAGGARSPARPRRLRLRSRRCCGVPFSTQGAARACDRVLDRRPAGADDDGDRASARRATCRCDRAAYAADLHDDPRGALPRPATRPHEASTARPSRRRIYLAPGGLHMVVRHAAKAVIGLATDRR